MVEEEQGWSMGLVLALGSSGESRAVEELVLVLAHPRSWQDGSPLGLMLLRAVRQCINI